MAAKIIERLVAELGFKVDATGLEKFQHGIEQTKNSFLKTKLAVVGFIGSILAIPKSASTAAESLDKLLNRLNASTSGYHELENAVSAYGESVESLNGTLETLKKKSQDVYYGDAGAIKGFTLLGISAGDLNGKLKNTDELLLDISDRIGKIRDASQRRFILSNLGIGEEFYENFLSMGSERIKALSKRNSLAGYIFTERDRKAAREFNQELRVSLSFFKGLKNELGSKLYPEYVKITKKANDFFIANRRWISLGVDKVAAAISGVMNGLALTIKGLINGLKDLFLLFKNFPILLLAIAPFAKKIIFALGLVFTKVRLIILLLGAAFLAVEDLYYYINGKKLTITEDIVNGFKNAIPVLKALVTDLFNFIREQIAELFSFLPSPLQKSIKIGSGAAKETVRETINFLEESGILSGLKNSISSGYRDIKGFFGLGGGEGNNITQNNNINIVTTTKEAAEALGDAVNSGTDKISKYIRDTLDSPKVI